MKLMTMRRLPEMRVGWEESMREPRSGRMLRCGPMPVVRGVRRDGDCGIEGLLATGLTERLPVNLMSGDVSIPFASLPPFRGRSLTATFPGFHPGLSPCRPFGAPEDAVLPLPCLPT